ncbi:MAG: hypothetical protein Q9215_002388 [Flavoplaca cf. flavocitrina]
MAPMAKRYRCQAIKSNSRPCTASFHRASGLERHQQKHHQSQGITFVHCDPATGARRRSIFESIAATLLPSSRRNSRATAEPTVPPLHASPFAAPSGGVYPPPVQIPAGLVHAQVPPLAPGARNNISNWNDVLRSSSANARTVPTYEVKQSRRVPSQQRGASWIRYQSKQRFEEVLSPILERWGVGVQHWGTCVLIPEAWRFLEPIELVALLSTDVNLPLALAQGSRACYSYDDHATSFARAKAWYSTWPRRGCDLDNFVGTEGQDDYKPMDASHLCHHKHCIIHIVYEAADVNQDRARCQERAQFLRRERRAIPDHCTQHQPPCLLQHAALTTLEACHIQASVFCLAKNLPPLQRKPCPRRYPYPTFESALPCTFSSVSVIPDDLVSETVDDGLRGRPNLNCTFCPPHHLRGYASIIALWAHIVHHHQAEKKKVRLQEVCRTAAAWQEYWDASGGRKFNPTAAKLE